LGCKVKKHRDDERGKDAGRTTIKRMLTQKFTDVGAARKKKTMMGELGEAQGREKPRAS